MFTNKYDNNIKSYKGFGVVTPRYEKKDLNYKSEINNLTDKNLDYTPPLFNTSYKNNPQDTNGYLNSKNYIKVPKTTDNYYYTSQQMDKIDKYPKYDKKNPFKFPPVLISTKVKKINDESEKKKSKNNKNDKNDKNDKNNKNNKNNKNDNEVLSNKLINKKWYNDRYLYSFEPRYNDVIKRDRLYTWSYPFMPNTDNYYRDDIKERGISPIIFKNTDNAEPLPDYDNDSSNIENIENFEGIETDSNYKFIYVLLISCVIITIIIKNK